MNKKIINTVFILFFIILLISLTSALIVVKGQRFPLANGRSVVINIVPEEASATALTVTGATATCAGGNCVVELQESGNTAVYMVHVRKPVRLFGFIGMNMNVVTEVNAETGEFIVIHRPWWRVFVV